MSISKPWERPWSMDEIIQNSDNWNLAGDVALLNTLKSFADNLLTKTTEINNNLNNLTASLDETSLRLNIAQNEFQNLRNSQFIESRVYEDDESLPEQQTEVKNVEEGDHSEDIRSAALKGLEVLDQFFEKVPLSVSDTEDEDIDLPNYVLRPKDLYIQRPLPYVIGTEEWYKTNHVGLEDSSSDSETEKVSDNFSESDSESDLPIIQERSQIKSISDTSSELDFSQKIETNRIHKNDNIQSSDSENSIQASISSKNFAEQLAAKLGTVIQDYEEPEINKRPILTKKPNYGDMFFDEPPPLDEPSGLFSGGGGLFDDDDDDVNCSTPKETKPDVVKSKGLFEDSDEDIFAKKTKPTNKTPLFNEEPPELEQKKKPVGGVSIFGGGNIFDKKLLKRQPSSDEEVKDESDDNKKKVDLFSDDLFKQEKVVPKISKKVNLFDSDDENTDELFNQKPEETKKEETKIVNSFFDDDNDDLFATNATKKFTSSLFENSENKSDNLFDNFEEIEKSKSDSLFDDLLTIPKNNSINSSNKENSDNLFSSIPVEENVKKSEDNLFSSVSKDLFVESDNQKEEQYEQKSENLFMSIPNESEKFKPKLSLFDSPPPETEDLFSVKTQDTGSNLFDNVQPITNFTSTPQTTPTMRLFDPSPPPDDVWDTKSEHLSENEDFNDFNIEPISTKTDIFSEEPPSFDVETNVKLKPGKLKHNLNINVGALMPGYMPSKWVEDSVLKAEDAADEIKTDVKTTDNEEKVEVLHCITKDRARALNRRPSTRRGRKEALKYSPSDFKLNQEIIDDKKNESETVKKPETDLFAKELQNVTETKTKKSQKQSLFDDDEDDDDLFASKKPIQIAKAKKSLFDDEENDDDIFKGFSTASVKKADTKVATEKKIPKVTSVKKLENTKSDIDPLSALLK